MRFTGRRSASITAIISWLFVCALGCAGTRPSGSPRVPDPTNPPVPAVQFDTKGADFGPWTEQFTAEVRKNWFIPVKEMSRRGRVVISLTVQRDGRITDVALVQSSGIEGFDKGALHAISASSPTRALPAEYPDPQLPLTVTFYYNEPPL